MVVALKTSRRPLGVAIMFEEQFSDFFLEDEGNLESGEMMRLIYAIRII